MHSVWLQAQKVKSDKSQTYKACKELGTKLQFGLTGTPMQNTYAELYNLVDLCAHLQSLLCMSVDLATCMQKGLHCVARTWALDGHGRLHGPGRLYVRLRPGKQAVMLRVAVMCGCQPRLRFVHLRCRSSNDIVTGKCACIIMHWCFIQDGMSDDVLICVLCWVQACARRTGRAEALHRVLCKSPAAGPEEDS